ncbi:MAG: hypothetical protein NXI24_15455 [bacterium]|nr:hypothetical protein [bacterium]
MHPGINSFSAALRTRTRRFALTFAFLLAGILHAGCHPVALEAYRFGPTEFKGAAVAHVHRRGSGYGSDSTRELYRSLKELGYNSVQLNTFAYQPRNQSLKLQWDDPTLTGEDLVREIKAAHASNLKVLLKPHIWVGGWSGDDPEHQWRSKIDFDDSRRLDAWFAEYARFMLPQARLAEEHGVVAFAVGTELVGLTHSKNDARWRKLIREVRAVYSGRLTYACEAWNAKNISFWDDLDAVGLDFYYGYPPKGSAAKETDDTANKGPAEPPTGVLAAYYRKKLTEHFSHAGGLGKPLWLTEIGFPSHDRAVQTPHAWPDPAYAIDLELQSRAYEALHLALAGRGAATIQTETGEAAHQQPLYPEGMWIWKYTTSLDSYEQRNYARGFNMQDKPAERIIRRIFKDAPRRIK